MESKYKKSFLGSVIAFVLGTSCCWLTSVAVWLGGATVLTVISNFTHKYQAVILTISALLFIGGMYQFWKHKKKKSSKILSVIVLTLTTFSLFAQNTLDHKTQILGKWNTHDNRAIIEIYEANQKFYGKIVWLQNSKNKLGKPKVDVLNPNANLRNRQLKGLTIMKNFTLEGGKFKGGTIYDPDSGSTYDCKLWLTDTNTLKVRDYCGVFYKTFTWTRAK